MTTKVYIAGPMSGLPDYNYPAFNAEAARLRALGYEVFNPAENPKPEPETWQGYMRMAVGQLIQVDRVCLLPGWKASRGATVERDLALKLDIDVCMASCICWKARSVK